MGLVPQDREASQASEVRDEGLSVYRTRQDFFFNVLVVYVGLFINLLNLILHGWVLCLCVCPCTTWVIGTHEEVRPSDTGVTGGCGPSSNPGLLGEQLVLFPNC